MRKIIIIGITLFSLIYSAGFAENRDPFSFSSEKQTPTDELQSTFISIHYAHAKTIAEFINDKRNGLLPAEGYVSADDRTNQLFIRAFTAQMPLIQKVIHQLDTPIAQLLIKVRIISIDENQLHSLGIIFSSPSAESKNNDGLLMDLPGESGQWQITIPIIKLGNERLLDLTLTALQGNGRLRMISSPELITNDRQTASIESGESIPYQERTGESSTTTSFKKATLRLEVTPTLLPDQQILLQLLVNQDKISALTINGIPAIATRQLTTQVTMHNQDTVILGGIYEESEEHEQQGIPTLQNIPILGALFRHRKQIHERKELLIFVTPSIITPSSKAHPMPASG